jgi:predicted AlkP superfamily phosphohydrolase/phosphomutase
MTTGLMTPPGSTDWIYPKELKNQINAVAGGYLCDIPPDFHSMLLNRRKRALDILKKMTSKSFRVSRYAASKCDWDLLAVIFTATDRLQHFWWREPLEITKHFRTLDSMLAEYVEYANSLSADLVIVSDHGFGPCDKHFMINEWLEKFGLASYRESSVFRALSEAGFTKSWIEKLTGRWPPVFSMLPAFLQDIIRRSIPESRESKRELDIARSVAYARSPAGIFVRGADWQDTIITKLREVTDHATGSLIFDSVMKRNDVMQGQYSYRAADLLLQPTLGYDVSVATRAFDSQLVGTHRPEGIFIHYRPGSIVSYEKENMPIRPWDVPAIILHVLDVPIPGYFDGRSKITGG